MINENVVDILNVSVQLHQHCILDLSFLDKDEILVHDNISHNELEIYNAPTYMTFKPDYNSIQRFGMKECSAIDTKELTLLSDIDDKLLQNLDLNQLEELDYKNIKRILSIEQ